MAAVAAIMIGVIAAQQCGVAHPQSLAIRVNVQFHDAQRLAVLCRQKLAVLPHLRIGPRLGHPFLELRADGVERVGEVGPFGRRAVGVGRKGARLPLPPGKGALGGGDFLRRHAGEEIIALIEFAHMVQAQPAPARPFIAGTGAALQRRRAELARFGAATHPAGAVALHPAMEAVEAAGRERVGRQSCPDASRGKATI